jgi:hypothetical protein
VGPRTARTWLSLIHVRPVRGPGHVLIAWVRVRAVRGSPSSTRGITCGMPMRKRLTPAHWHTVRHVELRSRPRARPFLIGIRRVERPRRFLIGIRRVERSSTALPHWHTPRGA